MNARLNAHGKWERRYTIIGTRRYANGNVDVWNDRPWAESLHALFASRFTLPSWATEVEVHVPGGEVVHCVVVNGVWCLPPEWDPHITPEMIDVVPTAGAAAGPAKKLTPPRGQSTLPPPRLYIPDDMNLRLARAALLAQLIEQRRVVGETEGVDWFPGDPPHTAKPAPTSVPGSGKKTSS